MGRTAVRAAAPVRRQQGGPRQSAAGDHRAGGDARRHAGALVGAAGDTADVATVARIKDDLRARRAGRDRPGRTGGTGCWSDAIASIRTMWRTRGHHTICTKLHAKGNRDYIEGTFALPGCAASPITRRRLPSFRPFSNALPLNPVLKQDFEREIPRLCRPDGCLSQTFVCETRLIWLDLRLSVQFCTNRVVTPTTWSSARRTPAPPRWRVSPACAGRSRNASRWQSRRSVWTRGSLLARLVSAHHACHAGPRLSGGHASETQRSTPANAAGGAVPAFGRFQRVQDSPPHQPSAACGGNSPR